MKTRKEFDIHSGRNLHKVDLVDKNGNPIDVYPTPDGSAVFIIDGTAYSMEEAKDMLFEEVDDERIDVYKTDVSDYAKEFQKNEDSYAKHAVIECSNWFFGLAGIFCERSLRTGGQHGEQREQKEGYFLHNGAKLRIFPYLSVTN